MRHTTYPPKGTPVDPEKRARLEALVRELGEAGAAKVLGLNRQTVYRAMAGLPVYRGTHALLAARLEQPATDSASPPDEKEA